MAASRKSPTAFGAVLLASIVCGVAALVLFAFTPVGIGGALLIYILGSALLAVLTLAILHLLPAGKPKDSKAGTPEPNGKAGS